MKKAIIGIIVGAIIIGAIVGVSHKKSLGDATVSNYPTWYYNGIVIGPNNKLISQLQSGSCTLSGAAPIASGATGKLTCSVTGAKVGDVVVGQQNDPTVGTTPVVGAGVTTDDTVYFDLSNVASTSTTPSGAALNVHYILAR